MMRFTPAFVAAVAAMDTNPAMYAKDSVNCYNADSKSPAYTTAGMTDAEHFGDGHLGVALYFAVPEGKDAADSADDLVLKHQGTCGSDHYGAGQAAPVGTFYKNFMNTAVTQTAPDNLETITAGIKDEFHSAADVQAQGQSICVFAGDNTGLESDYPWIASNKALTVKDVKAYKGCKAVDLGNLDAKKGALYWCALPASMKCAKSDGDAPTTPAPTTTTTVATTCHDESEDPVSTESEDPAPPVNSAVVASIAAGALAMLA